jgi:tetratricopeptide (TPR) repeat protein
VSYTRKILMTPERWESIKNAFECAIESNPEDRARAISDACGGDPELIAEVEKLLGEHERLGDFLTEPAIQFSGALAPGTVIASRYEIESLLGRGGMGEVYRAHDRLLKETVALKTIRADQAGSSTVLSSLQREIQTARKVTHPNVCRVFDLGVHTFDDGSPPIQFLSMELLEGETLQVRIERQGRLTGAEALPLAVQMAEGLAAAHAAGIIHRDFKSGNVIVVPGEKGDRAVITDFGLARADRKLDTAATASLSGRNILAGTIGYMSPEQLTGGRITPASDIYSLGIVLFEMITGRLPFSDSHFIQAAVQRVSGNLPSVRQLAPGLDKRWERVIRRCLETKPEARISPAKAVADALRRPRLPLPNLELTRRQWIGASAAAAVVAAAPVAWYERRKPYVPRPEAERWYEQGVEHVYETTYDAARKALEQAIAIDPDYAPAHAYLGLALRELDYPERAREEILTALALLERKRHSAEDALRVKATQLFVSSNYDLAQPLIDEQARQAQGRRKQQATIEQGMLAMYRNRLPDAQQAFQKVLTADPSEAGAQLRIATVYARQRKNDLAIKSFDQAETLFRAANNIDGVTETLFQRGVFLARANRSAEAIPALEKGISIARDTGDIHHEVRLQLALGVAYVNLGQTARAQQITEEGIKKAIDSKMEHAAAVGLLDLGNVYLQRGPLDMADKYFLQGLEFARQTKSQRVEMRALLSLGSLRVQSDRPREAIGYIEKALPYYQQGSFLRETMQSLLLLGRAQGQLGRVREAEQTLRKAALAAEHSGDLEQLGLAHDFLATVLLWQGNFPSARIELQRALQLYAAVRGGQQAAFGFVTLAVIESRAGISDKAAASLSLAEARLSKLEGTQTQLRSEILTAHAELSHTQRQWAQAERFARQAVTLPGNDRNPNARFSAGLSAVRMGKIDSGVMEARGSIQQYDQQERLFSAAAAQLELAQALWESNRRPDAQTLAKAALAFFEPIENWEAIWRCRRILDDPKAAEALDRCRQVLGAEMFESYRKRPILEKLLP